MNAACFGIKRWHLRIVELSKRLVVPFELTPARFDLMRIVAVQEMVLQKNLVWLLGVSDATVSRMLKSLEKLGFVKRRVHGRDARVKEVRLTPLGRQRYEYALGYCVDSRKGEQMVASGISGDRYANVDAARVREKVLKLEDLLLSGRSVFRDKSPVRNPWADVDFVTMELGAHEREANPYPLKRRRKPKVRSKKQLRPWEIAPTKWPDGPTAFIA